MSKNNSIEDQIVKMHSSGLSRKEIASRLKITEWKVRTTVRSGITDDTLKKERKVAGTGRLRISPVSVKSKAAKQAAILSDIHIPYHDQKALSVAIKYLEDLVPDDIILNGDIIDNYNCSSYGKDPNRLHTLQDELNETKDFLKHLRNLFPSANIIFLEGNHETRLQRRMADKAEEFGTLEALAIEELIDAKKHNVTYLDSKQQISLGDLEIFHGSIVRSESGASARSHHAVTGGSLLMGHTHRMGVYYKTNKYGTHIAVENGFLGRMDFEYADRPNWQQGFTTVSYCEDGRFSVRQHFINDGSLIVDDKVYTA